jgi:hypothetical protein
VSAWQSRQRHYCSSVAYAGTWTQALCVEVSRRGHRGPSQPCPHAMRASQTCDPAARHAPPARFTIQFTCFTSTKEQILTPVTPCPPFLQQQHSPPWRQSMMLRRRCGWGGSGLGSPPRLGSPSPAIPRTCAGADLAWAPAATTATTAPHLLRLVSIRQHTPAYASIRQHTSAYVSIRERAGCNTCDDGPPSPT